MELRPYQIQAIEDICQNWHTHTSVLYQGATGSGKTEIAKQITNQGMKTLFVVHRKELLEQNQVIFRDDTNVDIAMVQTISRRKLPLDSYDLIVIDEAHHASSKSYEYLFTSKAKILGLTATPKRLDGRPLGDKFDVLIKGPTIQSLINDGYLARPEIYVPPKTAQLVSEHESEWKVTAGDYNQKAIQQFFADNQKLIHGDVLEHYRQLAQDKPTIVFCPSVKSVYETMQLFQQEGIASDGIDGTLQSEERKNKLSMFRAGVTKCLMSCDLISEGFDMSDAYAAIMLRPTKSLTVYLQQAGRVLRMKDDKHACIIIDHVNNTSRFGPPWIQRYWSLEGYGQRKVRDSLTGINMKLCTRCGNYIRNGLLICPHCGKVFKSTSKKFKVIYEELQKITIESAQKLIENQCQKILNKEKWKMQTRDKKYYLEKFVEWNKTGDPEEFAAERLAKDKADFDTWKNGDFEALTVMYAKQKRFKGDPAGAIAEAKKRLQDREEFHAKRMSVFEVGTDEEVRNRIENVVNPARIAKGQEPITNIDAYMAGIKRKRLAPVLENGTEEQKAEAKKLVSGADSNGNPTASAVNVTGSGAEDKFTQMIKFAKSGKVTPLNENAPRVLTDEEAEKFARNVVRKAVKADLDSGDPVRVRSAVEKLHVKNVDAYVNAVLAGDK